MADLRSGRGTESIAGELDRWYTSVETFEEIEEERYAESFHIDYISDMLEHWSHVPFCDFMLRYLLSRHETELRPILCPADSGEDWMKAGAKKIKDAAAEENPDTEEQNLLDQFKNLIFDDFVSNGFYIKGAPVKPKKVRGSVNRGVPDRSTGEIKPILWDKDTLFRKIMARKLATDFSNTNSISDDEMFAFGFGLNMKHDEIELFLQKALRRSKFNLWNWKEFLLDLTFRYAEGDRYAFYVKLKDVYENDKALSHSWIGNEAFSTQSIQTNTEKLLAEMKAHAGRNEAIALDEKGQLPKGMKELVCKYKYLNEVLSDGYTRTGAGICAQLLEHVKEAYKRSIREQADNEKSRGADAKGSKRKPLGYVHVYYSPEKGVAVPKGTVFFKYDKKHKRYLSFKVLRGVRRIPRSKTHMKVQIPLECVDPIEEMQVCRRKDELVPIKTAFQTELMTLENISNKSYFKLPKMPRLLELEQRRQTEDELRQTEARYILVQETMLQKLTQEGRDQANGELQELEQRIRTARKKLQSLKAQKHGTVTADCVIGETIPAGIIFRAIVPNADQPIIRTFRSITDVTAELCIDVLVQSELEQEEALKGEITSCSIEDWQNKFIRIENSKIGEKKKQKEEKRRGGRLFNYLYSTESNGEELENSEALKELDFEALGDILEGTKLSSTKLSNIEKKKEPHITRNDVLTLTFLSYSAGLDAKRYEEETEWGEETDDEIRLTEYRQKKIGFISAANRNLEACGFYGVYEPNPYDALLIYLISNMEPLSAFRELWELYLFKNKEKR